MLPYEMVYEDFPKHSENKARSKKKLPQPKTWKGKKHMKNKHATCKMLMQSKTTKTTQKKHVDVHVDVTAHTRYNKNKQQPYAL